VSRKIEFDAGMKLGCVLNSVSHSCGAKAEHCQRRGLDITALHEMIDLILKSDARNQRRPCN
jgi:hypothetical protein